MYYTPPDPATIAATRAATLTKIGQALGDQLEGADGESWPANVYVHAAAAHRNLRIAVTLLRAHAEDLADPATGGVTTGLAHRSIGERPMPSGLAETIRSFLRLDRMNHDLGHPDGAADCMACEIEQVASHQSGDYETVRGI